MGKQNLIIKPKIVWLVFINVFLNSCSFYPGSGKFRNGRSILDTSKFYYLSQVNFIENGDSINYIDSIRQKPIFLKQVKNTFYLFNSNKTIYSFSISLNNDTTIRNGHMNMAYADDKVVQYFLPHSILNFWNKQVQIKVYDDGFRLWSRRVLNDSKRTIRKVEWVVTLNPL